MGSVIADVLLVSPRALVRPVCVEIAEDGTIAELHEGHDPPAGSRVIFDGAGEVYLTAGFIDIHTHGANGADLSHATPEAVETIAEAKLAEGVTTFLPTTWTASREHTVAMAEAAAAYRRTERFARAPYLHVEGPFLNPDRAGAQDARHMRPPDAGEIRALHDICPVRLLSLAPERSGAVDCIRDLGRLGIRCSAAHSAATYAEFAAAREAGLAHLTHYGNQMSGLHHREIGLVGAGLLDERIGIELICDKVHLSPDMVRLVFRHCAHDRLMLITDSIAASHLGDGEYLVQDTEIVVRDGAARIPDGSLAGSVATFDQVVRNAVEITGLPLNEISRTWAANQARSLGLTDRGGIQQGCLADLTLLSPTLEVVAVYVGGKPRYSA